MNVHLEKKLSSDREGHEIELEVVDALQNKKHIEGTSLGFPVLPTIRYDQKPRH
jgi:hypothetical protein